VRRVHAKGFILDSNRTHESYWVTEEKLYNVGARLEISPRKSLVQLPQQLGVPASSSSPPPPYATEGPAFVSE
jgi:hypothetical protein